MNKFELKQLIKEVIIEDLTQRNFPNEQNVVIKQYLNQLHDIKNNYTDDEDDLKNLASAVDLFYKELMKQLKS